MIKLFTQEQYDSAKYKDLLSIRCTCCQESFCRKKKNIRNAIMGNSGMTYDYCSTRCAGKSRRGKIKVSCTHCLKKFQKVPAEIKRTKNNFCSQSCSAKYGNAHKKHGTRRSKLEAWLEEQLIIAYPELEIHFNRKDAINSELDIYIPSIKLAFELNGIFHYEPIFGKEKLASIQNNDQRKFQACLERGIEFCTIDTSSQKYFKEKTSQKFLTIICDIIDVRYRK